MKRLIFAILAALLLPACALAQLQTGDALPPELEGAFFSPGTQRVAQYAMTECDAVMNALLLLEEDTFNELHFYQLEAKEWLCLDDANVFRLPPHRKYRFSGDDASVTLTLAAEYEGDDEERFTFTWQEEVYALTDYAIIRADGTASVLKLLEGRAELTERDPKRTDSPLTMEVARSDATEYLFSPILTKAGNKGNYISGAAFYCAFYYVHQASGFVRGKPMANVAMFARTRDGLQLRKQPDAGSDSLGMFYGWTPVTVLEGDVRDTSGGLWCYVKLGDLTGYMKRSYLSFVSGDHQFEYPYVELFAQTNAETELKTAAGTETLPTGASLRLLGASGECYYVQADSRYGFVLQRDVTVPEY